MANPVIGAITTYDSKVSALTTGAVREFWIRIPGLSASSAADTNPAPMYSLLNPFDQDMVVFNALLVVTTVDATGDADIDVGLGDNADGSGTLGAEIFESMPNNAVGVHEGTVAQDVAGTGAKCIWKKPGSSSDSYIIITQDGALNAADFRWHLLLKLIPYEDLIGDEGTQATITTE